MAPTGPASFSCTTGAQLPGSGVSPWELSFVASIPLATKNTREPSSLAPSTVPWTAAFSPALAGAGVTSLRLQTGVSSVPAISHSYRSSLRGLASVVSLWVSVKYPLLPSVLAIANSASGVSWPAPACGTSSWIDRSVALLHMYKWCEALQKTRSPFPEMAFLTWRNSLEPSTPPSGATVPEGSRLTSWSSPTGSAPSDHRYRVLAGALGSDDVSGTAAPTATWPRSDVAPSVVVFACPFACPYSLLAVSSLALISARKPVPSGPSPIASPFLRACA